MSEWEAVNRTNAPRTRASLSADLRTLGLAPGMTVLVHSSLSRLGWVAGGPVAVIQALMDVVTPAGTIVMPAFSTDLSEPSGWERPPVPESWWPIIRAEMSAFDPAVTPTRGLGRIAECFRTFPGVRRSGHPQTSFAAWGKGSAALTASHPFDDGLGDESPLGRLYEQGAHILFLGTDYETCTAFHLAEHQVASLPRQEQGAPVIMGGERVWQTFEQIDYDSGPFKDWGLAFEVAHPDQVVKGAVGSGLGRLFPMRPAVDFAVELLEARKTAPTVDKVMAYLTRIQNGQQQVLVFDHEDAPEAGTQVPAGTLEPGEDPAVGVLRELFEESGVEAAIHRHVATYIYFHPWTRRNHRRHVYELRTDEDLPDRWVHTVSAGAGDKGMRFICYWMPVSEAKAALIGGHGDQLSRL